MGYKQGIARRSSAVLLIFSTILLAFYIGCGNTCIYESKSFYSPIWTALSGMFTAFIGLGMAASKAEKKCGCCFLLLCILLTFISLGCVFLSFACFYDALDTKWSSQLFPKNSGSGNSISSFVSSSSYSSSSDSSSSEQLVTPDFADDTDSPENRSGIAAILWLCMMGTAGVIATISIVASCMFCCCQEARQQSDEAQLMLTGSVSGQRGQQGTKTGVPPGVGYPPPYNSSSWATTNSLGPGQVHNQASLVNSAPSASQVNKSMIGSRYMDLQQSSPEAEQYQNPTTATDLGSTDRLDQLSPSSVSEIAPTVIRREEEEYSYIENIDSNASRARMSTPDEYYDEVGEPERPSLIPDDSTGAIYAYASPENPSGPAIISSRENRQYSNSGVRSPRPIAGNTREPAPVMPEYLDMLP